MKNKECKVRPEIMIVVVVTISMISMPKLCVSDAVNNKNIKLFNLFSRTNKARHIKWNETCKCKCRLDESVCNSKHHWNRDKCRCKCKKLIGKGICDKGFIWNQSNCKCECDKLCNVGE